MKYTHPKLWMSYFLWSLASSSRVSLPVGEPKYTIDMAVCRLKGDKITFPESSSATAAYTLWANLLRPPSSLYGTLSSFNLISFWFTS